MKGDGIPLTPGSGPLLPRKELLAGLASRSGDGSTGIANPFAPGAGVQFGAGEAGYFEAEQIVAGGDAGAAHGDQMPGLPARQALLPAALDFVAGEEMAVCVEICGKRMVHGTGYVAGHGIDGFDGAGVALLGSGVDQQSRGILQCPLDVGGAQYGFGIRMRYELRPAETRMARLQCAAAGAP